MTVSILIVDDSKIIRKMLSKELLDLFGESVPVLTEASNGIEAIAYLTETNFDLVFLDLTMPEKTGYEVLKELQQQDIQANIIVLTADIQPEAKKIVTDLGAIGYIEKARPLNTKPIVEILKNLDMI